MRRYALVVAAAVAVALSGCAADPPPTETSVNPTAWWSALPSVTPSASATPSLIRWPLPVSPIEPYGDGSRFAAGAGPKVLPLLATVTKEDGFDRIVIEAGEEGDFGFEARYVDEAIDARTGKAVRLNGKHILQVQLQHVRQAGTGEIGLLEGALPTTDTAIVAARVFPYHTGQVQLLIGLNDRAQYRVFTTQHPSRFVIDIKR